MVMGEFVLTASLVASLQARGVVCMAATRRLQVSEAANGSDPSKFEFGRFRQYPPMAGGLPEEARE